MKKLFQHTLYILILTMTSCTLSMEEFVLPEDQKGKDEAYTETTEYGEFTYQYNDDVTSLNGEPQDYIAMMNDSVIWFMDNMPEKWIPVEGHYIAANCSETVPLGLCQKVISVSREGGMIRVEHKQAAKNEVFKKLELRLNLDYVMPGVSDFRDSIESESETRSRSTPSINRPGFWKNDSVFVDMSLYKSKSRGDDGGSSEPTTFHFPFPRTFDLKSGSQLYVDLLYKSTEYYNIHYYENLEEEYVEDWRDTYTERNIKVLVGLGNDPDKASKSLASFPKDIREIRGMKQALTEIKTQLHGIKTVKQFSPTVSIPNFPFCVQLLFDASVGYTITGYGEIELMFRSDTHRSGYIINKGTKTKIDKKVENPDHKATTEIKNIRAGGTIDFWLRVRAGIGILFGTGAGENALGIGGVVGPEIKAGLKATLETEASTDLILADTQNFKAGFYGTFSFFAQGIVKIGPITHSLGDLNFLTYDLSKLFNMKAVVNSDRTKALLSEEEVEEDVDSDADNTGRKLNINAKLYFDKLETFFVYPTQVSSDQQPALRIYEAPGADNTYKAATVHYNDVLVSGRTYEFNVNPEDYGLRACDYYRVIPCIYDKTQGVITEYREDEKIASLNVPRTSQPKCYQTFGSEVNPYDFEKFPEESDFISYYEGKYGKGCFGGKDPADFTEYGIETVVELKNASRITEWGITYSLFNCYSMKILEKKFLMSFEGVCKAGKYTHNASFLLQYKSKQPGSIIYDPSAIVTVYYVYDGKIHYNNSKVLFLQSPYER